jgi:DNA-binding IclR family transcriptional regulator
MENEKSKSLQRIVAILDCFTYERPELGVREIARLIGFSSSTTGRLLQAMKENGLLQQNPLNQSYSLGGKVLAWAGVYSSTLDVRNAALGAIQDLHRVTRETISLYVLEGNERVCVERLESTQNVRIVARLGRRVPLYAGSAGKVFLAFLPPARRDSILKAEPPTPITASTIVDIAALMEELKRIRRKGYAVSFGEWVAEASGVAAPIFDARGEVVAALTISGPGQRFTEDVVQHYVTDVTRVAGQISREMGFTGKRTKTFTSDILDEA